MSNSASIDGYLHVEGFDEFCAIARRHPDEPALPTAPAPQEQAAAGVLPAAC